MARNTDLTGDLAALAGEERSRLGEPPDGELLLAYHDGDLPHEEEERVRDWLAVDPELASIYLDLKRGGLGAAGVSSAGLGAPGGEDDEVEAAWRALAPKLKREASTAEVVAFPRRGLGRAILAVAAAVIVAVGLGWLLMGREGPELPEGEYFVVAVTGENFRGLPIEIPQDYVGVEFRIDIDELPGRIVIELRDASNELVRREGLVNEPGSNQVTFRVPKISLRNMDAYTLSVRRGGASRDDPALMDSDFRIVFLD
jgi:hypothetical protein